mmetsp:Transcript_144410/g.462711  ORF Transcript_144410/g.462711 Transcript_144410/m.462711 type:complete len:660 (-) Transcript_144410:973-2952(-)
MMTTTTVAAARSNLGLQSLRLLRRSPRLDRTLSLIWRQVLDVLQGRDDGADLHEVLRLDLIHVCGQGVPLGACGHPHGLLVLVWALSVRQLVDEVLRVFGPALVDFDPHGPLEAALAVALRLLALALALALGLALSDAGPRPGAPADEALAGRGRILLLLFRLLLLLIVEVLQLRALDKGRPDEVPLLAGLRGVGVEGAEHVLCRARHVVVVAIVLFAALAAAVAGSSRRDARSALLLPLLAGLRRRRCRRCLGNWGCADASSCRCWRFFGRHVQPRVLRRSGLCSSRQLAECLGGGRTLRCSGSRTGGLVRLSLHLALPSRAGAGRPAALRLPWNRGGCHALDAQWPGHAALQAVAVLFKKRIDLISGGRELLGCELPLLADRRQPALALGRRRGRPAARGGPGRPPAVGVGALVVGARELLVEALKLLEDTLGLQLRSVPLLPDGLAHEAHAQDARGGQLAPVFQVLQLIDGQLLGLPDGLAGDAAPLTAALAIRIRTTEVHGIGVLILVGVLARDCAAQGHALVVRCLGLLGDFQLRTLVTLGKALHGLRPLRPRIPLPHQPHLRPLLLVLLLERRGQLGILRLQPLEQRLSLPALRLAVDPSVRLRLDLVHTPARLLLTEHQGLQLSDLLDLLLIPYPRVHRQNLSSLHVLFRRT